MIKPVPSYLIIITPALAAALVTNVSFTVGTCQILFPLWPPCSSWTWVKHNTQWALLLKALHLQNFVDSRREFSWTAMTCLVLSKVKCASLTILRKVKVIQIEFENVPRRRCCFKHSTLKLSWGETGERGSIWAKDDHRQICNKGACPICKS